MEALEVSRAVLGATEWFRSCIPIAERQPRVHPAVIHMERFSL
jgi:hypothetical protein